MFERFTDGARRVVVGAQAEARALDHHYIGTEHILLGLLRDRGDPGFQLLQLFDVSVEQIRQRVEEIIGRGSGPPSGHIPFTPRAKKVLEMSLREALQLGHNYIGTEHILLGLLREGQGVGAQVLAEWGVTVAAVRDRVGGIEREERDGPRDVAPGMSEPIEIGIEERAEAGLPPQDDEMIEIPAEQFARLVAEIARLRDLLRHHGIDPGEEPPGFGQE